MRILRSWLRRLLGSKRPRLERRDGDAGQEPACFDVWIRAYRQRLDKDPGRAPKLVKH
jgi:hypothetical protein